MSDERRSGWGDGPWVGEPDEARWIDEETGYPCLAIRHPRMGHFCGYVGVPDAHQLHGQDYGRAHELVAWEAHPIEELTWAADKPGGDSDERASWWFGFDFAHLGDVVPGMDRFPKDFATYKTLEHTKRSAGTLAAFLKETADA